MQNKSFIITFYIYETKFYVCMRYIRIKKKCKMLQASGTYYKWSFQFNITYIYKYKDGFILYTSIY